MTDNGALFWETVSKNTRGRPRKHQAFHAMSTKSSGNPLYASESYRNNANGHYALMAVALFGIDPALDWILSAQVVRTELGRVIEIGGKENALHLMREIASAYLNEKPKAHNLAAEIRASRLAALPKKVAP